jgi:hypothetical protein
MVTATETEVARSAVMEIPQGELTTMTTSISVWLPGVAGPEVKS